MATKLVANKKPIAYDSSHIESLSGLEGVRRNPDMYLGDTGATGVFKCSGELLDNALDEHAAGRCSAVWFHADKDDSYWVTDNGLGVPQGVKEVHIHVNGKDVVNKVPTMQAIFGELHTSGKYRSDAYKTSIGTHGIGSKGTNATAEYFDVVTFYKKKWYSVGFKKGKLTSPVKELSKAPKGPDGKPLNGGTCIHFKPDPTIFKVTTFPLMYTHEWAEVISYLTPGFAIKISAYNPYVEGKIKSKVYLSKLGPSEYVTKRIKNLKAEFLDETLFEYKSDLADVVVAFTNFDGCDVKGFTSGLANSQGGTHVNSVNTALYNGLSAALLKMKKKWTFTANDFKEGLVGLVNARLHKAKYSSQDKAKLTDERTGSAFTKELTLATTDFFIKNKKLTLTLHERASQLNALKAGFSKSKKLLKALTTLRTKGMPAKYTPYQKGTPLAERELFIVEGESAGGSARNARLSFQAVLPLKGKVINSCFVGETEIKLANGTVTQIKDVTEPVLGWGRNLQTSYTEKNELSASFITRHVTEALVIEFEDGSEVTCTPEHLFLTTDGYIEAHDLTVEHTLVTTKA